MKYRYRQRLVGVRMYGVIPGQQADSSTIAYWPERKSATIPPQRRKSILMRWAAKRAAAK